MRLNNPLDKILNSDVKIRALRVFCQSGAEFNGRQMAKLIGVTPKAAHEVLQALLREEVLTMRPVGKTYLFRLNESREIVPGILKPLFKSENGLRERLLEAIRRAIKKSSLKSDILSVALFGSVHAKTERPASDVDLLVVVGASEQKKKAENFFADVDQHLAARYGNLISPYMRSLGEFKRDARKKTGVVREVLKSYQLIYGDRLEKLLR